MSFRRGELCSPHGTNATTKIEKKMRVKWVVFVIFMVEEIPCGEHSSPLQCSVVSKICIESDSRAANTPMLDLELGL